MKRIAIIPARGGSKRLPKKNVIDFYGKPIIAYSILAALKTNLFEQVVVSTEDKTIAKISRNYGAHVAIRPDNLATDSAKVVDVCLHFLEEEAKHGRNYDILCCLYATAPLRNEKDIRSTVALVENSDADFAMAVTEYHFPPHQALKTNHAGFLEPMWPTWNSKKSQEVPPLLVDNGSTYVVSVPEFCRTRSFYGSSLRGYVMPRTRSVDIDTKEDLQIAYNLFKSHRELR